MQLGHNYSHADNCCLMINRLCGDNVKRADHSLCCPCTCKLQDRQTPTQPPRPDLMNTCTPTALQHALKGYMDTCSLMPLFPMLAVRHAGCAHLCMQRSQLQPLPRMQQLQVDA